MPTEVDIKNKLDKYPSNPWLLKYLGDIYLSRKDYDLAIDQYQLALKNSRNRMISYLLISFEEMLRKNPKDIYLRFSLVKILQNCGESNQALEELKEIRELDPENKESLVQLFRFYQQNGYLDMAVFTLEQAKRYVYEDLAIAEMLASAYVQQNRLKDAVNLYQKILNDRPDNIKVIKILAELYKKSDLPVESAKTYLEVINYDNGCLEELSSFIKELIKQYPKTIQLYEMQAEVFLKWFKPDLAVETYKQIQEISPEKIEDNIKRYKKILDIYPDYPEANFALADSYLLTRAFSDSVLLYNRVVDLNPAYLEKVIEKLKKVIALCPEQVLAHQTLANCLLKKRSFNFAIEELRFLLNISNEEVDNVLAKAEEIVSQREDITEAYLLLAEAFFIKEDFLKAEEQLNKILLLEPKNKEATFLLAKMYFQKGSLDLAEKNFKLALIDSNNKKLHYQYQAIYQELNQQKVKIYEKQKEKSFNLAQSYYQLNDYDKAIITLQNMLNSTENLDKVYFLLGRCFKEQGYFNNALANFQKAVHFFKDNKFLAYFLLEAGLCGEAIGKIEKSLEIYKSIIENSNNKMAIMRINYLSLKLKDFCEQSLLLTKYNEKNIYFVYLESLISKSNVKNSQVFKMSFAQNHNNQAIEYFFQDLNSEAANELNLALKLEDKIGSYYNNLGVIMFKKGNIELAKMNFKKACEVNLKSAVAHFNLAFLFYCKNEYDEALNLFEKAIAIDPLIEQFTINLGDTFFKKGNLEKAIENWQNIANNSIFFDLAQKKLKSIGLIFD